MSRRPPGKPRLPGLPPDRLTGEQRAVYDAIAKGRRAEGPQLFPLTEEDGRLRGPFNAMLLSPPVGGALQALGSALRYESDLTARERELAILVVAAHWGSAFEWEAHVAVGRHVGLTDAEIEAIRTGEPVPLDDEREAAVVAWVRELTSRWDVDDEAYARAEAVLGLRRAYELSVLVGYYSTLALQLRVFAGERPPAAG
ncbi:carboxymuconolactone decarboxylase family protein [Thermostaphylospora chromogena]|uniref:4-carboxymuconolactone decarboxylase n=1 Tax=Thermostaphylospora chromogena TaxID=35622 RepID=A0A1H1GT74_9ACTN|nr:carboxymuconolactone decarboxylase family protein [Thermostaphylospora chromogena]SDR16359.1 4-carboxymuconolactone decarboxylase [Thermostaphylospora chromogena]